MNSVALDVSNISVSMDTIITKFAGENGVPPQLIKGQMRKETSFRPCWRYEPFTDARCQSASDYRDRYFRIDYPFVVSIAQPMGTGDAIPDANSTPSHLNVLPTDYPRSPISIADYVTSTENWFPKYIQHLNNGLDGVIGSEELTMLWEKWYRFFLDSAGFSPVDARNAAHTRLRRDLTDGSLGEKYLRIAQTRTATSYGFIQILYLTAVDNAFSETHSRYGADGMYYMIRSAESPPPEKLNELDWLLPRYCDFILKKLVVTQRNLRRYRAGVTVSNGQWALGFDETWQRALQRYNNGEPNYGRSVMEYSRLYAPAN